jgi:hypothetical protein
MREEVPTLLRFSPFKKTSPKERLMEGTVLTTLKVTCCPMHNLLKNSLASQAKGSSVC